MPAQQNETLNVVSVIELSLEIFNEAFISLEAEEKEIITIMDRTQLIRIITNLVKNAIQAISDLQIEKQIYIKVKKQNNAVLIQVIDNGSGIDAQNIPRIFEPKFTTKTSGMGLGLGIIKNIIENYKGTITFESEIGIGTTFTVTLPLIKN
jgi:signal transduction histidine kinase